jgi:threonine synthase
VSDEEILDGKAQAGAGGFGCEPASGASIAGAKRLREEGVIAPGDRVVCILTGHELKDPTVTVGYHADDSGKFANRPIVVENDLDQIIAALRKFS